MAENVNITAPLRAYYTPQHSRNLRKAECSPTKDFAGKSAKISINDSIVKVLRWHAFAFQKETALEWILSSPMITILMKVTLSCDHHVVVGTVGPVSFRHSKILPVVFLDHLRLSKSVKEGTKLTCELSMIVARFISEYTIYLACAVISELMIISSVSIGCTIAAEHQKSHKTKPHKCDGCDGFMIKTRLSQAIVAPTAAATRYPVPAKTASCKWCLRVFVVLYRTLPHLILF
ncbi:unnamed protein product [Cylicocyclus nassatus]|uniref:Uncharacterized protein n=1 Tax=Cylicocyclus nassatus TaxID=53992 RepID=A0AA36H8F8_CYLNA|nr:unnamed protein product [Cylicocyclus nassatus]